MSLVKWKNDNGLFPNLSSMFDNFFNDDDPVFNRWIERQNVPAVNVIETGQSFDLDVAAPGMVKEDFKIEVDSGVLVISSEKEESSEETKGNFRRKEFSYSSFSRSFLLPENVNEDDINAAYKDGVLTVSIPKIEIEKTKTDKKTIVVS